MITHVNSKSAAGMMSAALPEDCDRSMRVTPIGEAVANKIGHELNWRKTGKVADFSYPDANKKSVIGWNG